MPRRLVESQIKSYHANGYLIGLPPVFTPTEVARHNADYRELLRLLRPGESVREVREWHETSRWLFDICMNPQILDYVEDVLRPSFYLWASNFFAKEARSPDTVGWHQDAYYWPLSPHHSVPVWLAFTDSNESNAAMKIIPGSHQAGLLKHGRSTQTGSVLTLECESGQFREDSAVSLNLRPGEISLHDDRAVHGSGANLSDQPRIGLTIRYSGTNVKCDLSVNPHFKTYLCRGVDEYRRNPVGVVPTQRFGRLERKHLSVEEAGTQEERLAKTTVRST